MESQEQTKIKITTDAIDELKGRLPFNSYAIIERKVNSRVKARTIQSMFNHHRTMRPDVWQAAVEFVESLESES